MASGAVRFTSCDAAKGTVLPYSFLTATDSEITTAAEAVTSDCRLWSVVP